MAKLISLSICLTDIDKSKIKTGKNGKSYLDVTVSVNDEKDQYGKDVSIYHSQTKEEREAKEKKKFLGNGTVFWKNDLSPKDIEYAVKQAEEKKKERETVDSPSGDIDDLPF